MMRPASPWQTETDMAQFRTDNTDGYTTSELAELNAAYETAIAELDVDNVWYKSTCDAIAQDLLAEFDAR